MDLRSRETARVVLATVYLSTFSTAVPHTYLSTETAWAQPTTGIESPTPLPPLQLPALANSLQAGELNRLRIIALEAIQKSPIQSNTVVGIHHVRLNPFVVQQVLKSNPANSAPKVFIELPNMELPNMRSAVIVTDSLQPAQDSVMWKGHIDGVPGSRVRFIVNPTTSAIYGSVEMGRFIYEIRPSPSDTSVMEILAIDPSGFPPEHGALIRQAAGMSSVLRMLDDRMKGPLELTAGGGPPVIDVMILYTKAARDQDPNGIAAMACQAVEDLKDAFANSGIQATARLVHHGVVGSFVEPSKDIETNLDSLLYAGTSNGNEIYNLRNTHAADVVSLWVSDADGQYCGLSPSLGNTPLNNAAFSVVVRRCARDNKSFIHEVGHILLADHDRFYAQAGDNPTTPNPTKANYGYVKADKDWMTVMSYDRADCPVKTVMMVTGAVLQKPSCNRRLSWSNPLKLDEISGDHMGQPSTATRVDCNDRYQAPPIDCQGPADNATVLNNWVGMVAAFRPLEGGPVGTLGNTSCVNTPVPTPDTAPPLAPQGLKLNRKIEELAPNRG